jgi:branched-chain amino acid transport system substrate-binding protein
MRRRSAKLGKLWEEVMIDRRSLVMAGLATVLPNVAFSQTPGVTDKEIKIGSTCAHSGPASSFATNAHTQAAYFKMINEKGGIADRMLTFLSYDTGASPPRTLEETRRLVEQDGVALLFNLFGTAANSAVARYTNDRKVPHLFAYSGADKFSDPATYPWTMGWQPSYRVEGQVYAKYAKQERPNAKIGVLFQNDDFGKDYIAGMKDVLGHTGLVLASHEMADPSIDSQILTLAGAGCDVIVSATSPKPVAQAIRKLAELPKKPLHIISNVSTSVASVLTPAGLDRSQGTISSSYLKDPNDPAWADDKGLAEWRAFLTKYYPTGDPKDVNNLIGYCFAVTLVKVLEACKGDFARENIMKQASSLSALEVGGLLPGITISTSASNYRPIRQLQMVRFDGTTWQRFGGIITA